MLQPVFFLVGNKRVGSTYARRELRLLLTCCDRLGQPERWLDFGSWLASRSRAAEREAILAPKTRPVRSKQAGAPYEEYRRRYGVQNAFFRFFDQVLPRDARDDFEEAVRRGFAAYLAEVAAAEPDL